MTLPTLALPPLSLAPSLFPSPRSLALPPSRTQVKAHNADATRTWRAGVNAFSDLTADEWAALGTSRGFAPALEEQSRRRLRRAQAEEAATPTSDAAAAAAADDSSSSAAGSTAGTAADMWSARAGRTAAWATGWELPPGDVRAPFSRLKRPSPSVAPASASPSPFPLPPSASRSPFFVPAGTPPAAPLSPGASPSRTPSPSLSPPRSPSVSPSPSRTPSRSPSNSRGASPSAPPAAPFPTPAAGATVDWRAAGAVTAVRDQGTCGSCCE